MITLLMVLFIVMFAISQVDQRQFEMLKDGIAAGFGSSPSPFQGSEGTVSAEDGAQPLRRSAPRLQDNVRKATQEHATQRPRPGGRTPRQAEAEVESAGGAAPADQRVPGAARATSTTSP